MTEVLQHPLGRGPYAVDQHRRASSRPSTDGNSEYLPLDGLAAPPLDTTSMLSV